MFILDFHRDRQIRIDRRLEIAPDAERSSSTCQQDAAAKLRGELRERGQRLKADIIGGHVLQNDCTKCQKARGILWQSFRGGDLYVQFTGAERSAQVVRPAP